MMEIAFSGLMQLILDSTSCFILNTASPISGTLSKVSHSSLPVIWNREEVHSFCLFILPLSQAFCNLSVPQKNASNLLSLHWDRTIWVYCRMTPHQLQSALHHCHDIKQLCDMITWRFDVSYVCCSTVSDRPITEAADHRFTSNGKSRSYSMDVVLWIVHIVKMSFNKDRAAWGYDATNNGKHYSYSANKAVAIEAYKTLVVFHGDQIKKRKPATIF